MYKLPRVHIYRGAETTFSLVGQAPPLTFLSPPLPLSFTFPHFHIASHTHPLEVGTILPFTFPSLSSPPLPSPISSPPFPLEVVPWNPAKGSRGALQAPPVGSGAKPRPIANFVHFSFKICRLVAATLSVYNMQLRYIGRKKCIVWPTNSTVGRATVLPAHYVPAPLQYLLWKEITIITLCQWQTDNSM